jgi:hypothetical protein
MVARTGEERRWEVTDDDQQALDAQEVEREREHAAAWAMVVDRADKDKDKAERELAEARRQVEVLAKRIDAITNRYNKCCMCPLSADGYRSPPGCECGQKCAENMIEWSLEQAKKGGAG